jgi:NNP family nitrate/nitrite transporter-like MFS transporter
MMIIAQDIPWALAGAVMMALGMGVANAGVFKLVPKYLPQAVGGGAGLVGGLGAFGGFAIPPVMGFFVQQYGQQGYSSGFLVFFLLSLLCLSISWWLLLTAPKEPVVCQEIFTTDLRSEDRPAGQEQRVDTGSMPL